MGSNTVKLKKLRTFHSDMERIKPSPKPETPVNTPAPTQPTKSLTSVLNPKKVTTEIFTPPPSTPNKIPQVPLHTTPKVTTIKPSVPNEVVNQPLVPTLPSVSDHSAISKEMSANLGTLSKTTEYSPGEKLNVMDTDNVITEGTIITDKKRERFSLLPAMVEAIKDWFSEGKESIERRVEKKRLATPTVSTIEDRKEILKKAAHQSAQAPKDDYKKLTDKLPKKLAEKPVPTKSWLTIVKKEQSAKPGWSHFEENQTKPVAPVAVTATEEKVPDKSVAPAAIPLLPTTKEEPATKAPLESTVPKVKVEPVELTIKDKPAPPPPRKWKETPRPKRFAGVSRFLFFVIAIVIALVSIAGGVMLTMWFFGTSNGLTPTTQISTNDSVDTQKELLLIREDRQTELPLPRSRAQFYKDILTNSQDSGGINVIIPTIDGAGVKASTGDILETLAWQGGPALLRAINEVNFGMLGTTPFIIMRVTSFDTAFGGLLYAEDKLSNDLSPLFGEPVTGSFSVSPEGSKVRPAYFEDDTVRNHDVRVLRDELEKERIVYGFVNQNTVIITTDRGTFSALAEAIR